MKALQLHYTSCRRGLSGGAGFQVRAVSQGIDPEERREIERRSLYRPPRDAVAEPTAEQIDRDFPRSLRAYRLSSGRLALTRSCCAGRDYSGRWGNFFAHSLVLPAGTEPTDWPIDYYEWPGWKERLVDREDTEDPPAELSEIEVRPAAETGSFALGELAAFLQEEPGREELLARMGRALLAGLRNSRAVVIRDSPVLGLYWTACLQKIFPPRHAWAISSSTYEDDPRGCAQANATVGTTDFAFDETARRFRFYVFDLDTGVHSEVEDIPGDYPAIIAGWLAREPQRLNAFFRFMEFFDHGHPEPELIAAVDLFELWQDPGHLVSEARMSAMIAFAHRYALPAGRGQLVNALASAAGQLADHLDASSLAEVVAFLALAAQESGQQEHRRQAIVAWLALVEGPLLGRGEGLVAVRESWDELRARLGDGRRELAEAILAASWSSSARRLEKALPSGDVGVEEPMEIELFLLHVTWIGLEEVGREPVWEQPEVVTRVDALAVGSADATQERASRLAVRLFAIVPASSEALAGMARLLACACGSRVEGKERQELEAAVGEGLAEYLANASSELARGVRRELDDDSGGLLLYGEWIRICRQAKEPERAFEQYRQQVLSQVPHFAARYRSRILSVLLNQVEPGRRAAVALNWLRSGEADSFPASLAEYCLALGNGAVPLTGEGHRGDEMAELVQEKAKQWGVALEPDRPFLRHLARQLDGSGFRVSSSDLKKLAAQLPTLSTKDYSGLLPQLAVPAIRQCRSMKEHQQVLLTLYVSSCERFFAQAYACALQGSRRLPWPAYMDVALIFWLRFSPQESDLAVLDPIEAGANKALLRALTKLKPKQLEIVRARVGNLRLDPTGQQRWRAFESALEARRRGPLARFKRLFVRH